jgi:hypothetical protein
MTALHVAMLCYMCTVIRMIAKRSIAHLDRERKYKHCLTVTSEHDVVVRARMFRKPSVENGGDSANDAARVRIVFAGAHDPLSGLLDVDLTRNMAIPEGHGWHDRYWVKLIVDALYEVGKNVVHEARKVLVTNPGHTVPDNSDDGSWGQYQSKADTVEQSKRGAKGMPYDRHHRTWVHLQQAIHGLEHKRCGPGGKATRQ